MAWSYWKSDAIILLISFHH